MEKIWGARRYFLILPSHRPASEVIVMKHNEKFVLQIKSVRLHLIHVGFLCAHRYWSRSLYL